MLNKLGLVEVVRSLKTLSLEEINDGLMGPCLISLRMGVIRTH